MSAMMSSNMISVAIVLAATFCSQIYADVVHGSVALNSGVFDKVLL